MHNKERYILFFVLVAAFLLRVPHLDFPAIGYHNMKENEYISMAKNMAASGDFVSRDVYFYNAFSGKKDFGLYPQIPFVAYQVLLGYRLFGDNLWFPRLLNIILMLLSVVVIYRLAVFFLKERIYALMVAVLVGILPLGVYCSRNLQPESGAFLFMSLGNLFLIRFMDGFKRRHLVAASCCVLMTAAYKISFLTGFAPLALIFPYPKYLREKRARYAVREALILALPLLLLLGYLLLISQLSFSASWKGRVEPWRAFSASYWRSYASILWHYAKNENFTSLYILLFAAGTLSLWIGYKKDRSLFAGYLRAWFLVLIAYFAFFSDYLNQHSYYQLPFLGFVSFVIVYFMRQLSRYIVKFLRRPFKEHYIGAAVFAALLLISRPELKANIDSHFDVIYAGTDEVGRILGSLTSKDDRLFIYTFAQGYAPCVYAERRCGWCGSLEELKENERKFNVQYLIVYPYYYIYSIPTDIWHYISGSYHINLVGFSLVKKTIIPVILVLKKGGVFDEKEFYRKNSAIELDKVYRTPSGAVPFYLMRDAN
ncbi:MAG: glycosyltransferase family 39 protein [Candidatus Omnitrophota bacterium]